MLYGDKMENKRLIYAVDDEQSIREVYAYALKSAGFEIECFQNGEDFLSALSARKCDLAILDIMLDGLDGYEILKAMKSNSQTSDIPVIMVSAKSTEIDKVRGLDLGADDYLAKPFGVLELVARINAKLRKSQKSAIEYKDIRIDDSTHCVNISGEEKKLTLKQYELLKLLVQNSQNVLSRNTLLDSVWGDNYGETRTLDIHIADLRKLLAESTAQIETVRGVGYVLK